MSALTLQVDAWPSQVNPPYYRFFSFQIVELTATLTLDEDGNLDGIPVAFPNIGNSTVNYNPDIGLQAYGEEGIDWWAVGGDPNSVQIYMTQTGPREGVAKLRALVTGTVGTDYTGHEPYATCTYQSEPYQSGKIQFHLYGTRLFNPSYTGVLKVSSVDQTPRSANGNLLYFRFEVTADGSDPETVDYTGLPRMCIRLTSADPDQSSPLLQDILLYTTYFAENPIYVQEANQTLFVDLQTDEDGMAELYICAKAGRALAGSISCNTGVMTGDIGPILIADVQQQTTSPQAPHCDNPVHLEDGPTEIADVPDYTNFNATDTIFLFCNGRYQSRGQQALKQLPFQKAGLRSSSNPYNDNVENEIRYVAAGSSMIDVSAEFQFSAQGSLPSATLDPPTPYYTDTLPAPTIIEAADGWPVNCQTMANGLSILIPIDSRMQPGDQIAIVIALNGYRLASNEPIGAAIPLPGDLPWPSGLIVTERAMNEQRIEWWFQPYHFVGFGQMHDGSNSLTGSVGTLEVQYVVNRDPQGTIYASEVLSLGLDTIPPNGTDGIPDDDNPSAANLRTLTPPFAFKGAVS
ncbi:hypothetical protein [Phyllobacterium phragmitis]|uniref:Uncharacterized protein n=1 Tax=Phyllobacterium phragmitis TaxID=2670329 RepID=A0ABQ0H784_9HYPH